MWIRVAQETDVDRCQQIARQWSHELGFVRRDSLLRGVDKRELFVAEVDGHVVGFVNWHNRRDGISKIYEIAVDREYLRRDIGRALLYAVPAPITLSCPVDNDSNQFYAAAGMILTETVPGRKRDLNIWKLSILPILCAGSNKTYPELAKRSFMAYGTRHDMKPQAWPFMIDLKWDKYDWSKYLTLLQEKRPVFAMVADYEPHISKEQMLAQVEDLRRVGILRIGVCIKKPMGIPDIPADCVVCISVPAKYAGYLPPQEEWRHLNGRMIHLLGGSPRQWFGSMTKWKGDGGQKRVGLIAKFSGYGARIISLDGNSHTKSAQFNAKWINGKWSRPTVREAPDVDYHGNIEKSGANIVRQLQEQIYQQKPLF